MQQNLQQIFHIISALCSETCSQQELNQLAKLCLKMAVNYLLVLEGRGKRIRETGDKSELQGIASDCIADLFTQNKDGGRRQIQKYLAPRITKASGVENIVILLRQLITHKVQQHLTKVFAQRDPEGAKLIRNIKLAAKRFHDIELNRDVTGDYVSYSKPISKDDKVCRPNYLDLQNIFVLVFRAEFTVDKLVHEVVIQLSNHLECSVEVSIFDLVRLIRKYRSAIEINEETETNIDPLYYQREIELRKKVFKILDRLTIKLSDKYVTKNKLTLDESIAIGKALKDIAEDALAGEPLQENYSYLHKYWISLSRDEYFSSVRSIFEYFIRLFKDDVKKIIKNNSE